MKKIKIGLLGRIIIAIAAGVIFGLFVPEWLVRLFLTFNGIFSQFLGFIIPLIIFGLVTPAISDIGNKAGKMLLITVAIAYGSTVLAGLLSYLTGAALFPGMIHNAGSVASIGFVEDGIVQTLEEVPAHKIINAVPFYTRVWKTNGDKVTSEALDMETAQNFISRNNIEMKWLDKEGQNYGEIQKGNTLYQIWMEDKDSIETKLAVMRKYNVGGVAAWQLGFETPDIWDKIAVFLNN